MIEEEKKFEYWNHFTDDIHKGFRPKKITDIRLKLIKETVLDDDSVWQKIIARHHALDKNTGRIRKNVAARLRRGASGFLGFRSRKSQCFYQPAINPKLKCCAFILVSEGGSVINPSKIGKLKNRGNKLCRLEWLV